MFLLTPKETANLFLGPRFFHNVVAARGVRVSSEGLAEEVSET